MEIRGNRVVCDGCGQPLNLKDGVRIVRCSWCNIDNVIPNIITEEEKAKYNNANKALLENDFDMAFDLYSELEKIYPNDPQLHFCKALSRYGIRMEKDTNTNKLIPTINRMQNVSFVTDLDYKMALDYAKEDEVKKIFTETGEKILEIQKEYNNEISDMKPFDVFISFKEKDEHNKRSRDSFIAEELYRYLDAFGFRVFYSNITLKDEYVGKEYEPIIYHALTTAKVLIVVGTNKKNVNSTWVKNEWSRFLNNAKIDSKKLIILAYDGMKPEDYPDELKMYQGFEVSDNAGIEALGNRVKLAINKKGANLNQDNNIDNLILRAWDELRNEDFNMAINYSDRVLDQNYQNPDAFLIKLLAKYKVTDITQLNNSLDLLENHTEFNNYRKNSKDNNTVKELNRINEIIKRNIEEKEKNDIAEREENERKKAEEKASYEEKSQKYNSACQLLNNDHKRSTLAKCKKTFEELSGFSSSNDRLEECKKELNKRNRLYIFNVILFLISLSLMGFGIANFQEMRSIPLFIIAIVIISCRFGKTLNDIYLRKEMGIMSGIILGLILCVLYIIRANSISVDNENEMLQAWSNVLTKDLSGTLVIVFLAISLIISAIILYVYKDEKHEFVKGVVGAVLGFVVTFAVLMSFIVIKSAVKTEVATSVFCKYSIQMFVDGEVKNKKNTSEEESTDDTEELEDEIEEENSDE